MDTFKSVCMNFKGFNFVLGVSDGLSYEGLFVMFGMMSVCDNGCLDEFKLFFFIVGVRDSFKRVIEVYM